MNAIRLLPDAPDDLRAAVEAAGFLVDPGGPLLLAPWPAHPPEPDGPPTVSLVDDPQQVEAARAAGAVEALVWPGADLSGLVALARAAGHAQRRLRSLQRSSRRTLVELQSTRDLLGRLIDATPNPVMAVDLRGRVLVFNRAAETALGYDAAWAREHMHVTEVYVDAGEARRVLTAIRRSPDGIVQHLEARLRARSGEQLPVLLSAAEVYAADGMPIGTVGVFQDRRQELALKERLERATGQLIESEKRAAHAEVAGAAAHELNQPLTAVMGQLEILEVRRDLPPDVQQRLGRAFLQLDRMADIVRRLAVSSRPQPVGYVGNARIHDLRADPDDA